MSRTASFLLLLCFINFMSISFSVPKFQKYGVRGNDIRESKRTLKNNVENKNRSSLNKQSDSSCWMSLNAKGHFETMDEIDERYKTVRETYQESLGSSFSKNILQTLLKSRGVATRELSKGAADKIPAGLNLGGLCMMRMPESILFLHRIKLRNNTFFRVNMLEIDMVNMVITTRLSLNDLHLAGAYARVLTDREPGILYYTPTYGEVEFLLKDVNFNAEGRLRLVKDLLLIELLDSKITTGEKLMTYTSDSTSSYIRPGKIEDILERMKTDLQKWLKDYFNDFFIFNPLSEAPNTQFQEAENRRTEALNDFADYAIQAIRHKLHEINASAVQIPSFTLRGSKKMVIKLHEGALRGLDTMYRRSIATGKKEGQLRKVDTMIGFSSLKVSYKYEAELPNGFPPLTGVIILTSDDLTGHLAISLVKNPEAVDINIDSIEQTKTESLTVEGSANRLISAYRHLLEHHIIAIMTNALHHEIKMLRTLPGCNPRIKGNIETMEVSSEDYNKYKKQAHINQNLDESQRKYSSEEVKNVSESQKLNNTKTTPQPEENLSEITEKYHEVPSKENNQSTENENPKESSKEEDNKVSSKELSQDQNSQNSDLDSNIKLLNKTNYWLTKNESVEIEVPNKEEPGKVQRVKVHRLEEYKIIDK